ncbi:protein folded gastrulation [Drosophila tropicalis]|uniref:protein folded gastrulation n=1 Tax=Drosophila tropicalis TaxID=46794 RepID=UPI0035AB83B5
MSMMASSTSTSHTIAGRRWLWRLLFTLAAVQSLAHCLPITSRPLEGNAQRLAWQEWLDLPKDQKTPEKKVTAKSIFTLPFRRCPPGHKLYNERCIPQTNIDPQDVLKQELILAGGGVAGGLGNGGSPVIITDYDYGDEDEFSDELLYDAPQQQPLMQTTGNLSPNGEDQALPSEDAPLKFNLFEKKFPTGTGTDTTEQESLDDMLMLSPEMNATASINGNATATTTAATAPTFTEQATPTSVATTPRQAEGINNAIAQGDDLLQAASSNNIISSTTTTLRDFDISSIEAIVVPAGHRTTNTNIEPEAQSVQLVTSSLSPDADAETDANLSSSSTPLQTEADLAQLLKVDAFLPASTSRSNIEMLPAPYSNHRRVAPLLTAEELGEEATTDMVTTTQEDEGETKTEKEMETQTETEREMETETETETEVEGEGTTETTPTTMDEPENHLVLIKSKVQPVQLTQTTSAAATTTTTSAAAAATATTTTTEAVATDRFHYQHFEDVAASNSATSASSILPEKAKAEVKTSNSNNNHNNNIMTNTIASQHDDDDDDDNDKTSEINLAEELRIINELVKSKKRHQPQQPAGTATTRITTATIIESSTETTGTTSSTTESSTFIETEMEMATGTAATAAIISNNADSSSSSSSSSATTTPTAAATTTTTATQLSINTNRSNKNSKIIRVNNEYELTSKATTVGTIAAAATPNSSSNISSSDGYTPFWWLPNIGWRLDRQVDRHGEDRSLLLRFFSTFRAPSTGEIAANLH